MVVVEDSKPVTCILAVALERALHSLFARVSHSSQDLMTPMFELQLCCFRTFPHPCSLSDAAQQDVRLL
jgi:hypothetical protein